MPLHPLVVHFPVALLLVAALAYLAGLIFPGKGFGTMGFYLHIGGLVGSVAALLTGDAAEAGVIHTPLIHEMVERHESLSQLATWAFGLLGVWVFLRNQSKIALEKWAFVILFWAVCGLMAYSAHLGGRMVYEEGAGVAPMETQLLDQIPR